MIPKRRSTAIANRFFASERTEINLLPSPYHDRKAIIDRILGLFLLLLAAVPLAVLFALVRLSSRGPALFRQLRVGKNGRPFVMYKLRTMRTDAEAVTGPVWGLPHDPRATRMGKLLRKLHLDELPQLINVIKGEMSFVGPRPERPEFVPGAVGRNCRLFGPDCRPAGHHRPGPAQPSARQRTWTACAASWFSTANTSAGQIYGSTCRLLACTSLRVFKLPGAGCSAGLGCDRTVTLSSCRQPLRRGDNGSAYPADWARLPILPRFN